jgi:L-ascorbate metabolism protein UlaG (beta-lactamase superfamily)
MLVKISRSPLRKDILQSFSRNGVTFTTWGAIRVNKADFFPSSFMISDEGVRIYIDPVEIEEASPADYIFITHAHPDHFSVKDIQKILTPDTQIICPSSVAKKLSCLGARIHTVKPGDISDLDTMKIEAVPAWNHKPVFLWIKAHSEKKENVGFIITMSNGMRIYHAGDSDLIPAMDQIKDIDVAMIPIGGDKLTMDASEAAQLVLTIKPDVVIPMHFEMKDHASLQKLQEKVKGVTSVQIMK